MWMCALFKQTKLDRSQACFPTDVGRPTSCTLFADSFLKCFYSQFSRNWYNDTYSVPSTAGSWRSALPIRTHMWPTWVNFWKCPKIFYAFVTEKNFRIFWVKQLQSASGSFRMLHFQLWPGMSEFMWASNYTQTRYGASDLRELVSSHHHHHTTWYLDATCGVFPILLTMEQSGKGWKIFVCSPKVFVMHTLS